ncbi:MAG: ROK family protein [Planctomycetota bacterium]|jgi:glucokinase
MMSATFVGIDLGGTNIKIGCFDTQLKLIAKTSATTEADAGPQTVVDTMAQTAEKLSAENALSCQDIAAVGIGAPGPANLDEGIIIASPNMPSFKNVPLRKMVSDRFGKPAVLENDANAACWGEFVLGAGKDVNDMVFFTLGTGIGGGIVSGGKLVHGSADNAAELGHIIIYPDGRLCGCGQRGCVEAYASANSTAARATEAARAATPSSLKELLQQNDKITCKDVFDHAAAGDNLAKEITDQTAKALAIICVNMLHTTEPKRIVFAGGMIAAGDMLLHSIKEHFNAQIWTLKKEPVEIAFATLGEDAGIIGAAALARHAQRQC